MQPEYNARMRQPRVLQGDHSILTLENKLRWFRRLTVEQRYAVFEDHLKVIAEVNPHLLRRHAPDPSRSVRIVRLPQR